MRRPSLLLVLVVLASVSSSCLPILHGLVTDDIAVPADQLVGTWVSGKDSTDLHRLSPGEAAGDESWIVEKRESGRWTATIRQEAPHRGQVFGLQLAKLSSGTFLELSPPTRCACDADEFTDGFFVGVHEIFKVDIAADHLTVLPMDERWLRKRLGEGTLRLPHDELDDTFVITATSSQLRRFLERHAADPGLFAKLDP